MAPLPVHNTDRLFVDYSDGIHQHSFVCRFTGGTENVDGAMQAAHDLLLNIADAWHQLYIQGARHAIQGSNLSFPLTWSGFPTYGGGGMIGRNAPRQVCLLGRSPLGRRMRLFLFGVEMDTPDNYRVPRQPGNFVDDALLSIEASQASGFFLAIDATVPTMYPYADINYNNHFEKLQRG